MRFVADLILAPTVAGACCAREGQYIGESRYLRVSQHHAAQQDNKVPSAHSDIMNHAGRNTRRKR